jgi:hypothetical protein
MCASKLANRRPESMPSARRQLAWEQFLTPMDQDRVMKRFPPNSSNKTNKTSVPAWCQAKRLLHAAINRLLSEAKEVSTLLHQLTAQNELLNDENNGLRKALVPKRSTTRRARSLISNSTISTMVGLYSGLPGSLGKCAHVTPPTNNSKMRRISAKVR